MITITLQLALQYVKQHYNEKLPRLLELEKYYLGKNKILMRANRPNGEIPNKVPHNFSAYIANQTSSYFMGSPVDYVCPEDDSYLELDRILRANNASTLDAELALDMAIYGVAYEIAYIDSYGELQLAQLDAKRVIPIFNQEIKPVMTGAIISDKMELEPGKQLLRLSVYDNVEVATYETIITSPHAFQNLLDLTFTLVDKRPHLIGRCPITQHLNNRFMKGDYEDVIALIDTYDLLESLSLDDACDFTNAYLVLKGLMSDLGDEEEVQKIKQSKILDIDLSGDASWLIKNINDTFIENQKTRVNRDIHKISGTLDMTDSELFQGQVSGIALKWRYNSLELGRKEKERQFRRGLRNRLEVIRDYLLKTGKAIDVNEIELRFTNSMPMNESEQVDIAINASGLVSQKTVLSLLPFVDDIEAELARLEEEKTVDSNYTDLFNNEEAN